MVVLVYDKSGIPKLSMTLATNHTRRSQKESGIRKGSVSEGCWGLQPAQPTTGRRERVTEEGERRGSDK